MAMVELLSEFRPCYPTRSERVMGASGVNGRVQLEHHDRLASDCAPLVIPRTEVKD